MIRDVTEADLPAVLELVHALCRHEGDQTLNTIDTLRRSFLAAQPDGWMVLAEHAEGPVGYATAHITYESGHAERGAYVGDIFVADALRGQGIGRALLGALALRVRDAGGTFLWWTALTDNPRAHAFYRGLGCKEQPVIAFAATGDAFEKLASEA